MVKTISDLTPDQLVKLEFRRKRGHSELVDLDDDTNYAIPLLKLAPGVTQTDYPALKAAIEALPGVQEVSLLLDRRTSVTTLPNHVQVLQVRAEFTLRDDTPEEPE